MIRQDNALPFELCPTKVQEEADLEPRDAKIVEHLSPLVIRDAVDDLGVHDHGAKGDKVGYIF
jgi:hypothetical protein